MENIMMLPASYCVMNEEEMTYTTGVPVLFRLSLHGSSLLMHGLRASPLSVITARRTLILGLRTVWTISQMIWGRVYLISSMTLRVPVGFWAPPLPESAL